ncbi:hypothetical protein TWF132_007162 [Orbilia oligospora]|nr:hypothetical protein TWF132_007162 [Orbilia oligospora]
MTKVSKVDIVVAVGHFLSQYDNWATPELNHPPETSHGSRYGWNHLLASLSGSHIAVSDIIFDIAHFAISARSGSPARNPDQLWLFLAWREKYCPLVSGGWTRFLVCEGFAEYLVTGPVSLSARFGTIPDASTMIANIGGAFVAHYTGVIGYVFGFGVGLGASGRLVIRILPNVCNW